MKQLNLLKVLFFIFVVSNLNAQFHDNTWVLGYSGGTQTPPGDMNGITVLTFPDGAVQVTENITLNINFSNNNASFSNTDGNIISVFNGIDIADQSWEIMEGGGAINEIINPNYEILSDEHLPQGSIFLEYPNHPDSIILIYGGEANCGTPQFSIVCGKNISYAIINKSLNNGRGKVINRKTVMTADTVGFGQIKAVRHGNGRDWWVIIRERDSNRMINFLVSPSGITQTGTQQIPEIIFDGLGQSVFSPDGSFFAIYNSVTFGNSTLDVFNFDRCTGQLSNQRHLKAGIMDVGGVSFSSNSRYLYHGGRDSLFQFDMYSSDFPSSRTLVAVREPVPNQLPGRFYQQQLGPDGRIYICTTNGVKYLHIITRPDEPGIKCAVEQRGVALPVFNSNSVPNFPNYRLGPLDGSLCDTLGLNNIPVAWWTFDRDTTDPNHIIYRDLSYFAPTSWYWDFGDGTTSTEPAPEHIYDFPGVYEVCLTVSNANGSNQFCRIIDGITAASGYEQPALVQVGPNPFTNTLSVVLNSSNMRRLTFSLYDLYGRKVCTAPITVGINEVDTGRLTTGIYFYVISMGNQDVRHGKLIKME